VTKENRKNIPEEKKKARNQHDTSADHILQDEPEGRHFNEKVVPRQPESDLEGQTAPNAHLGAEEVDEDREMDATGNRTTTAITAPEIREESSEAEEETFEEIKRNMTGG
jgi:hypothetical protein